MYVTNGLRKAIVDARDQAATMADGVEKAELELYLLRLEHRLAQRQRGPAHFQYA
ncbi:hypothetical protein LPN01_14305 [Sphingomonas sp. A2-49]|uniref:hypothetical protein n=1 Tax=Sphingomonas sp. A2-49 TaxID=1391375 RepID=UPI0021D2E399|nr:hypothetical protein [Sphingomonas sp. A2-49]MCU6455254.1 hypothetical protein [Sphingomonas sp. A2-49]